MSEMSPLMGYSTDQSPEPIISRTRIRQSGFQSAHPISQSSVPRHCVAN